MPIYDQPAFIELLRSTRCADDALLHVALQPLCELLDLTTQLLLGVRSSQSARTGEPREPRPSVPPGF